MKAIVCGGRNVGRTDRKMHINAADEVRKAGDVRAFVAQKMDDLHVEKRFSEIMAGNEGAQSVWASIGLRLGASR